STTPLWVIALEWLRPRGEPLRGRAFLGLILAVGGVVLLLAHRLDPSRFYQDTGVLLVLASAFGWAGGPLILRHRRPHDSHVVAAAHQMFLGGCGMLAIGLLLGEMEHFHRQELTSTAIWAFLYLLVFHSLVAFVAISWLLGRVSPALVTTF